MSAEPRAPFDEPAERTSRYGPLFWSGLAVGGACMAFGLVSLLSKAGATEPANFALFFVGLALVHDLMLAPAVIVLGVALRRVTPRAGRGLVLGSLVVSAVVTLFSVRLVAGWGAQPDNPSFLPRNYVLGLAAVLAVVWGGAIALTALSLRRSRRTA